MLVKMWCNGNSPSLLMGMQNGTATLEDSLAVSYKTKHTLTICFTNYTFWYLLKRFENLCPHKNLPMYVYSRFNHNCSELEPIKMPFSMGMDKQTLVLPGNGILFRAQKKQAIQPEKTQKKFKCTLLREINQLKNTSYCMIPTI